MESAFLMTFRELVWSGSQWARRHEAVTISQQCSKIMPGKVVDTIIYQLWVLLCIWIQRNEADIPQIMPSAFQSNQIGRCTLSSPKPLFIKKSEQKKKKKDSCCMFQSFLHFQQTLRGSDAFNRVQFKTGLSITFDILSEQMQLPQAINGVTT